MTAFEWGFQEAPKNLHTYLFFTFGYHVFDFIEHMFFKEKQSDFQELLLHHIATCCLYFAFLLSNMMGVGAVIAWFHDVADIFVTLSRVLNCLGMEKVTPVAFISLLTVWIYTRNLILPIYIYHTFKDLKHAEAAIQPLATIQGIFLCVLQLLHFWWTVMMSKILCKLVKTGEQKDTLNRPEDAKAEKQD